jgi:chromosome partitioning protein
MTLIIAVVNQKGGVGKSTFARMIAREYANNDFDALIADMDTSQSTSFLWNSRRMNNEIKPDISVQQFRTVSSALKQGEKFEVLIFDGAPHATRQTLEISQLANLIILPTGTSVDELEPTIRLAHELKKNKVSTDRITIALSRVGNSEVEINEAIDYIKMTGYHLLKGYISEKTIYRRANDSGKTLTETTHPSTNQKADEVIQEIANIVSELSK